jgi:peptidoglycan/xylan/chitin deacetylase (PgdA/CDA1 family)
MNNKNWCKAIMYHYIRSNSDFIPWLKYLDIDNFKKQLDFFEKKFWFVRKEDWINFINNKTNVPTWIILTFDDWLIDHYKYVLPILKERNLWWIFFVWTKQLRDGSILNVHKIHYLLWRFNPKNIYEKFVDILNDLNLESEIKKIENTIAYSEQEMDKYSLIIKKINYSLDLNTQTIILDKLISIFWEATDIIWENLYLNEYQINEIKNWWNIIGWHAESHHLLSNFTYKELDHEINESNKFLSEIINSEIDCFCYPYWWKDSYNSETIKRLKKSNIKYSFIVEPRDIKVDDIMNNKHLLPRYDCNMFEYWIIENV